MLETLFNHRFSLSKLPNFLEKFIDGSMPVTSDSVEISDSIKSVVIPWLEAQNKKSSEFAVAINAGGTPLCGQDGEDPTWGHATFKKEGKKKVIAELPIGPSDFEIETLKNGLEFAKYLIKLGVRTLVAIPYYDTQGIAGIPEEEKLRIRTDVLAEPLRWLPEEYKKLIDDFGLAEYITVILSSKYSRAAKELVDKTKRQLDNGPYAEADRRTLEFFKNTGGIMYNAYVEGVDPRFHHVLLSTPGSRLKPAEKYDDDLDVYEAMREIGCVPISLNNRTHCAMATAGRLVLLRKLLVKKFGIDKQTPITTVSFQDVFQDAMSGVNWARAVELLTVLDRICNSNLLILSQRGSIKRIISSKRSQSEKIRFLKNIYETMSSGGYSALSKIRIGGEDPSDDDGSLIIKQAENRLLNLNPTIHGPIYQEGADEAVRELLRKVAGAERTSLRESLEEQGERIKVVNVRGTRDARLSVEQTQFSNRLHQELVEMRDRGDAAATRALELITDFESSTGNTAAHILEELKTVLLSLKMGFSMPAEEKESTSNVCGKRACEL